MRASVGAEVRPEEAPATVLCRQHLPDTHTATGLCSRAANDPSVFTIREEAPTWANACLK